MRSRTWHSCQPIDLHSLARHWFLKSQRIEMQKLARELGISRATAYRWAGSVELLIGEVLASLVEDTLSRLETSTTGTGAERVLSILNRGMYAAHRFAPLRSFLEKDPVQALRIVASKEGPVQARTIGKIKEILEKEMRDGHLTLTVEAGVMAYALTRIVESFLYADLIAGAKPDLENASRILALMLRQ